MSAPLPREGRVVIIAASGVPAAEAFARREGIAGAEILPKQALIGLGWRRTARRARALVVHTASWATQRQPQLFELALAACPGVDRMLADDAVGATRVGTGRLAVALAAMPFRLVGGFLCAGVEAMRFARRRSAPPLPRAHQASPGARAVLAVWLGEPGVAVGGSVTHISGILAGFGRAGYRVGLVTSWAPPPQLAAVVDDVEIVRPVSPGARVSFDLASLAVNRPVRSAIARLARRLPPELVYQRHTPYLVAGIEAAEELGVPLVLEWNGSEAWVRTHWQRLLPFEAPLRSLLEATERSVVRRASAVVAVSEAAAAMAVEAGAEPGRLSVVPNAVDLDVVAAAARSDGRTQAGPLELGWIGSFGPWHGAAELVRSLTELPVSVHAVMIGDGSCRDDCRRLAAELGVLARVDFAGQLPHDAALSRLGACDVLVSPHVPIPGRAFFGSPTKLFEYMALGKPIVASDLDQMGEVLTDGRTARLVTPGDPGAIAEAIRWVLDNPGAAAALGRAAREEAERAHTWDHRVAAVRDALHEAGQTAVASGTPPLPRATWGRVRASTAALIRSRTARQALTFAGSAAIVGLAAGIKKAILARALSAAAFAGYAFIGPALALVALVFEFGLFLPAGRAVARAESPDERRELFGAALLLFVPIGLAFCATAAAASFVVDSLFHIEVGRALLLAAPLAFVFPFQQLALFVAQGIDRLHVYSLTMCAAQVVAIGTLGGLVLAGIGLSLETALLIELGALAAGWAPFVAYLRPRFRNARARCHELLRAARIFGLQVYLGRLLSMGTYNMDVLLVAAFADARSVALYALASSTAKLIGLPMLGVGSALFPELARGGAIARRWLTAAWLTGLAGAAVVITAGDDMMRLLFSDAYVAGIALLAPLALAEALRSVTTIYNSALSAQARGRELRNTALVLTASNLALNFTLIPPFGAAGAAWASLGALALNLVAHAAYYRRSQRPSPSRPARPSEAVA